MKVLLTGGTGQVGAALKEALAPLGAVLAPRRDGMDLASPDSILRVVRSFRPELIVNAGAFTAVDLAESQPGIAATVNADAPAILAEEAKRLGAAIVQLSTDYVFDGTKAAPYVETDAPAPLNAYGRTKLEGEKAVAASGARHLILRTSWVYAAKGKNFLNTILRLAAERDELRVVDDQRGAPTSAGAIAEAVASLLEKDLSSGIFHMSCSGETTWYGLAVEALRLAGFDDAFHCRCHRRFRRSRYRHRGGAVGESRHDRDELGSVTRRRGHAGVPAVHHGAETGAGAA